MRLRIVSWNLNGLGKQNGRIEFLRSLEPDIAILLETTPLFRESSKEHRYLTHVSCSLDLCTGQEKRKRPLGVTIGSPRFPLNSVALLPAMPVAERALVGRVMVGEHAIDVCGFHAPPGVNWGNVKGEAYAALATWLVSRSGPTVLGIDGNSPKVDHPDHSQSEFWRPNEDLVLSANVKHRLRDSYRLFLEANPKSMSKIREERPDGPLALSYVRGKATSVPCRYDFMLVSPEFQVHRVDYPYNQSLEAGSDHSAVVADLELA
jgi:hypothetical protein